VGRVAITRRGGSRVKRGAPSPAEALQPRTTAALEPAAQSQAGQPARMAAPRLTAAPQAEDNRTAELRREVAPRLVARRGPVVLWDRVARLETAATHRHAFRRTATVRRPAEVAATAQRALFPPMTPAGQFARPIAFRTQIARAVAALSWGTHPPQPVQRLRYALRLAAPVSLAPSTVIAAPITFAWA
jgi:hypothetical protein